MAGKFEGRELLLEMLDEFDSGFTALGSGGAVVAWNRAIFTETCITMMS